MPVRDTSIEAYTSLLYRHELGARQRQVYEILKRKPCLNNLEISMIARLPINQITPRVKELRERGLVIDAGFKIDELTQRLTHVWKVV